MDAFAPLAHVPLATGTRVVARHATGPFELPELVHMEDPASQVMTDFNAVDVVVTAADQRIDDALQHMKDSGVRLLLVTDATDCVVGLITAKDIQGERPVRLVRENGIRHSELTVAMVMTPQTDIEVLPIEVVGNARVGDVVATLHELERQHALVADVAGSGRQSVRGVFSSTRISRQLGRDVTENVTTAHSLAEVVQVLG